MGSLKSIFGPRINHRINLCTQLQPLPPRLRTWTFSWWGSEATGRRIARCSTLSATTTQRRIGFNTSSNFYFGIFWIYVVRISTNGFQPINMGSITTFRPIPIWRKNDRAWPLQVCWICKATKGSTNMNLCYTDLNPTAEWRSTIFQQEPWTIRPHYTNLFGFELGMVTGDLLHIWNLGVLRDVVGGVLKVLVRETFVFDGRDIDTRFQTATNQLKAYAKSKGQSLKLKRLTKTKICWGGKTFPEFQGSGSDCNIVASWLESVLERHHDRYGDFLTLLWTGNKAMRMLYASNSFFLNDSEKRTFQILGRIFLDTFLRLAREGLDKNEMIFKVRPKFHILCHLVDTPRQVNIARYATWLDEDWLKKISHTMKLTSVKTSQTRVLQRWLMSIPTNLTKMFRSRGWKVNSGCPSCRHAWHATHSAGWMCNDLLAVWVGSCLQTNLVYETCRCPKSCQVHLNSLA